jgi:ribosomal protein S20
MYRTHKVYSFTTAFASGSIIYMGGRKKTKEEAIEKLEALGQESDKKAAKWVIEEGKAYEKKSKEKETRILTQLNDARHTVYSYKETLLRLLHEGILSINMPKTYQWGVWFDGKGIVLSIKDKYGVIHKRAFVPVHDPKYDFHMVDRYVIWAEDIYDMVEGQLLVPNKNLHG